MVRFGELVGDPVLLADAVEDVAAEERLDLGIAATVLGQVGEGHAVVGQHGVEPVGEDRDHLAQESGAVRLCVGAEEGDVDELRHPVDRQEHEQLALSQAQLAGIDVHVADPGLGEALALGRSLLVAGQARDAVPLQAAVQGAAGEPGDGLAQAAQDVIQGQQGATPELDDDRLLGLGEHRAAGPARPHPRVGRGPAPPPFGNRLGVQAVAGGQGAGRRLRPLELGSNARRRAG
jgi:hypothetical protein